MLQVMLSIVILSQFLFLSTRHLLVCLYFSSLDKYTIFTANNFVPDLHATSHALHCNIVTIYLPLYQTFIGLSVS